MVKGGEAGLYFLALTPGFTSPVSLWGEFTHQEKRVPLHLGCKVNDGCRKLKKQGPNSGCRFYGCEPLNQRTESWLCSVLRDLWGASPGG